MNNTICNVGVAASFITHEIIKPTKFISLIDHNLKITDCAIKKIEELRSIKPQTVTRIVISGGGCQGFQYQFCNSPIKDIGTKTRDIVLYDADKNLLLVFDLFSEFYVRGATINYISTLLETGFKIEKNPQANSSCSCKKSFASDAEFEDIADD